MRPSGAGVAPSLNRRSFALPCSVTGLRRIVGAAERNIQPLTSEAAPDYGMAYRHGLSLQSGHLRIGRGGKLCTSGFMPDAIAAQGAREAGYRLTLPRFHTALG
jgi:hypothetical protein